jgi:hypothetical protein
MAAGYTALTTTDQIHQLTGRLAKRFREDFAEAARLKAFDDAIDLTTLPGTTMDSGSAAIIGSALTDLDQLRTIYEGTATLGSVKDFRTFLDDLWGPL